MTRFLSSDTIIATIGTLAAVLSVIISQQWLGDKRDAVTVLMDEQTGNRHQIVQVEDTKRESVRLRDLNTLYIMLDNSNDGGKRNIMILDEAVRAYEIALISMAAFETTNNFDKTVFRVENIATQARAGEMGALHQMSAEFVRLYGVVDSRIGSLRARQQEIRQQMVVLRNEISAISQYATYLQVFGLILVMIATIVGLKRIEICIVQN